MNKVKAEMQMLNNLSSLCCYVYYRTCRVQKRAPLPSMTMNPYLLSSERSAVRAYVWNLLSQRHSEVLIGLNGSKSMFTIPLFTHQTVRRHFAVELESVLDRGDGPEHRESVHPGLDIGRCTVLISQHLGHTGNLIT